MVHYDHDFADVLYHLPSGSKEIPNDTVTMLVENFTIISKDMPGRKGSVWGDLHPPPSDQWICLLLRFNSKNLEIAYIELCLGFTAKPIRCSVLDPPSSKPHTGYGPPPRRSNPIANMDPLSLICAALQKLYLFSFLSIIIFCLVWQTFR